MCLVLSTKVESHDGFRGPLYLRARQPASQFSPLPVNIMPDRNTGVVMRDDAQIAILETFTDLLLKVSLLLKLSVARFLWFMISTNQIKSRTDKPTPTKLVKLFKNRTTKLLKVSVLLKLSVTNSVNVSIVFVSSSKQVIAAGNQENSRDCCFLYHPASYVIRHGSLAKQN